MSEKQQRASVSQARSNIEFLIEESEIRLTNIKSDLAAEQSRCDTLKEALQAIAPPKDDPDE